LGDYISVFKDLRDISQYAGNSSRLLRLMILFRNQIRDMLGGERDKITFGGIKHKFRTSRNKNTVKDNILCTFEGCGFQSCCCCCCCCCCNVYDCVFLADGWVLLL